MGNLMDTTMETVGGKEWNFETLAVPQIGHLHAADITDPISLEDFMSAAFRRCDAAKSTTLLFDIHVKIAEFGGMSRIGEQLQQRELERLPGPLLLAQELPPNAKMGVIILNLQDGTMNVLKMIHFPDKVGIIHAKKLCTGDVRVPGFCGTQCPRSMRLCAGRRRLSGLLRMMTYVVELTTSTTMLQKVVREMSKPSGSSRTSTRVRRVLFRVGPSRKSARCVGTKVVATPASSLSMISRCTPTA